MKHGAITFALLLVAGTAGALSFAGCSDDDPQPAPVTVDSGVDTGTDTKVPDTTPPDTNPPSCQAPLPTGFACEDPADKAGKTVCNDTAINEFIEACFGSGATQAKCSAAQTKYKACSDCLLRDWMYGDFGFFFDTGACIKKIDPTSTCAKTVSCNIDCIAAVCGDCDDTQGSGKSPTRSEQDDCMTDVQARGGTSKPRGACYDVVTKDYAACAGDPRFAPCFVSTAADVTVFMRGACRDNGNWEKAYEELPTDAGADAAGDTADTATTDTATADTADTATTDTATADTADTATTDTATDDTATDAAAD